MWTSISDLYHGFAVALQPANVAACFVGVLVGNMVGVLPGLGVMVAGIFYGAQYGGAICSILLNLPCHPPHAVTCLDGYPMSKRGGGGAALGITMLSSFVGASFGITVMIFFAPVVAGMAMKFTSAELFSVMLLGLLTGSTLARGSPLKGVAMMIVGLLLGIIGTDVNTGTQRFSFGFVELYDGVELVAVALGLFGIAEFIRSANRTDAVDLTNAKVRARDMRPSRSEIRAALPAMCRGTIIGSLCAMIPGTGPTIASFVSYAVEKKISKSPERFGSGAIEGVAAPEASTHSAVQGDFIPTMSLGIPGDAVMALLLGALMIHGISPGPQLINTHPDIFWGLIASFWIGNIMLVILNVPLIGIWVKLLTIPYRYLCPSALLFVCIGVYSAQNRLFEVGETLFFGVFGYVLFALGFQPAPLLLGFVLGPKLEEAFRRAMLLSRGDLTVFLTRPISAVFISLAVLLITTQLYMRFFRKSRVAPLEVRTRSVQRG
jgi:TctA family transporter